MINFYVYNNIIFNHLKITHVQLKKKWILISAACDEDTFFVSLSCNLTLGKQGERQFSPVFVLQLE